MPYRLRVYNTGQYRVVQGSTGQYRAVQDSTGMQFPSVCTAHTLYRVHPRGASFYTSLKSETSSLIIVYWNK